ncbi:MAG: hypothetical protein L3J91_04595, partial [Thermoplasmata archaeon]|nr:hypothetical protein [Thermoplasmata archaeon]
IAWGVARVAYPGIGLAVLHRRYQVSVVHPTLVRPLGLTLAVTVPLFLALSTVSLPLWSVVPLGLLAFGVSVGSLLVTRTILPGDLALARSLEGILRHPLPRLRHLMETSTYAPRLPDGAL